MSDLKEKMTEMSGLFSNKKLNVVDESGSFVRSSTRGRGGGVLDKCLYGEAPPRGPTPLFLHIQFFTKNVPLSYTFS